MERAGDSGRAVGGAVYADVGRGTRIGVSGPGEVKMMRADAETAAPKVRGRDSGWSVLWGALSLR